VLGVLFIGDHCCYMDNTVLCAFYSILLLLPSIPIQCQQRKQYFSLEQIHWWIS